MAIKTVISGEEFEQLVEPLKEYYKQEGEGYVLEYDGAEKVREFRSNNIKYMKELKSAQEKLAALEGIDPEEVERVKLELQEIKDKKLLEEGNLEELLAQRTERMRQDFDAHTTERG